MGVTFISIGDVSGPSSATDNAIARFNDTSGKIIQGSGALLNDSDVLTSLSGLGVGTATPNEKLHVSTSGTSGYTSGNGRGILLTDSVGPNIVFEDTGETGGDKIMVLRYTDKTLGFDVRTDNGGSISIPNALICNNDGLVGISTDSPNDRLHVRISGNSTYTSAPIQGILITDNVAPRLTFEDVGEAPGDKIISMEYRDENLKFFSQTDDGSGIDVDNILVVNRDGNIGIGTSSIDADSLLQLDSTTKGFLMPRMTTTERDAITTPPTGLEIYNTTTNEPEFFDGTIWRSTGETAAGGSDTQFQFNNAGVLDGTPAVVLTGGGTVIISQPTAITGADSNNKFFIRDGANVDLFFANTTTNRIGIGDMGGSTNINEKLHVLANGGTSTYTAATDRGILITDNIAPGLTFEDTGETVGDRVITLEYESQNLTFSSLTDDGLSFDVQNILVINRDGNIGINTATPDITSLLDISSTTAGFLMPRMTTAQGNAIVSPATGLEFYDTTLNEPVFYNGTSFVTTGETAAAGPLNSVQFNNPLGVFDGSAVFTFDGSDVNLNDSGRVTFGTNMDLFISHDGTGAFMQNLTGNFLFDNGDVTGDIIFKLGTNTSATKFVVQQDSQAEMITVLGNGRVGINDAAPASTLDVTGDINTTVDYKISDDTVLFANGGAPFNTFVGVGAGEITTGADNTATGFDALRNNVTGSQNAAFGFRAMAGNLSNNNSAFGFEALISGASGAAANTAAGSGALANHLAGDFNTAFGFVAGKFITGGTVSNTQSFSSTFLGAETRSLDDTLTSNEIVIGYQATGLGSDTVTLGNDSIVTTVLKGDVGIGTVPLEPLHISSGNLDGVIRYDNTATASVTNHIDLDYFLNETTTGLVQALRIRTALTDISVGAATSGYSVSTQSNGILSNVFTCIGDVFNVSGAGGLGINETAPNQPLHVNASGTSTYTSALQRGILITDSAAPRLTFENTGEGTNDKIMVLDYFTENMAFQSLNDAGNAVDVANIFTVNRDGNVGIGTASQNERLHVNVSGVSTATLLSPSGVLITDAGSPRIVFEDTTEGVDDKLMFLDYFSEELRFGSLNDDGDVITLANILTISRDGAVTAENLNSGNLNTDTLNSNTVYFTSEADLPTPSGGVITLQENTTYILYNDDPTTSQKQVILTNEIKFPDAGGCRITSSGLATALLIYTGVGTMFTTTSSFTGFIHLDEIFMAAPNGTIFDIDGVLPVGSEFFPRLFISGMGFFNSNIVGTIKNISYNQAVSAFFDCKQGIVFDHCEEVLISDVRFTDWDNEVNSIFVTFQNNIRFGKISNCVLEAQSNETFFDIRPNIPTTDTIEITNSIFRGTGSNFIIGTSGTITSVISVNDSGTITLVEGTSFGESIFTDVGHALIKGQIITQSGFLNELQYNGTFEVLELVDANRYRLHVLFTVTDTGGWDSDRIQFAAVNTLAVGDGVQVTNTTNYDSNYQVLGRSGTAFFVNGTFVATETGDFNTNSLTSADPSVISSANPGFPPSLILGNFITNDNSTATVIALADTYQAIDLTGANVISAVQRLKLIDPVAGVFEYTGKDPLTLPFAAIINALKTGSTQRYDFAMSINGASPAAYPFAPLEIKTTLDFTALSQAIPIVANDTFQVMVRGVGHTDNLTITDFSLNTTISIV